MSSDRPPHSLPNAPHTTPIYRISGTLSIGPCRFTGIFSLVGHIILLLDLLSNLENAPPHSFISHSRKRQTAKVALSTLALSAIMSLLISNVRAPIQEGPPSKLPNSSLNINKYETLNAAAGLKEENSRRGSQAGKDKKMEARIVAERPFLGVWQGAFPSQEEIESFSSDLGHHCLLPDYDPSADMVDLQEDEIGKPPQMQGHQQQQVGNDTGGDVVTGVAVCPEWRRMAGVKGWHFTPVAASDLQRAFFDQEYMATQADAEGVVFMAADVSASIPFTEDEYLWLFGDSLMGKHVNSSTWDTVPYTSYNLPRQSIGRMKMHVGERADHEKMTFLWRRQTEAEGATVHEHQPVSLFQPTEEVLGPEIGAMLTELPTWERVWHVWYWIMTAVRPRRQGPLLMLGALIKINESDASDFQVDTSVAIRITNPEAPVQQWNSTQVRFPGSDRSLTWCAGMVESGEFVYLVGQQQIVAPGGNATRSQQVLARVPLSFATTLDFSTMEVWAIEKSTDNPVWIPYVTTYLKNSSKHNLANLFAAMPDFPGATELHIVYHEPIGRWLTVTLPAFTHEVWLWTAPAITGPWTPTKALDVTAFERAYQLHRPPHPAKKGHVRYFYAPKIHPELARNPEKEIVLTFCCNILGVWPAPSDYTARFVRLELEEMEIEEDKDASK